MTTPDRQPPQRSILLWHIHGSWTQAFVAGRHRYLIPVTEAGDEDGRGLCGRDWPNATEVAPEALGASDVDLVILQRPGELELAQCWLGRRLGTEIPAVYVEHNTPRPYAVDSSHPMAGRSDITIVHVTDFNRLMWDNGRAPTTVIDHGIADPGPRYTGEIAAAAVTINEPVRRGRTVGTDLLVEFGRSVPIEVWGMGTEELNHPERLRPGVVGHGDRPGPALWDELARRRVYLHTARWTSLGLSLLEAMYLGMPVVAVAATMAPLVVPRDAGVVSADPAVLGRALEELVADPDHARAAGAAAREHARKQYGLDRFLHAWEHLIEAQCA
ncbi:glycosyltransferase [Mycolicibacillus trivialis]|uniref:Glycosyl transferase n=1 Tax=Mycolicibacillus trivialis TaxID=1798 RepID=A0A1X2EKP5_9MYCO|nr:glycosyltransferase [Mycolicibacillus trivialis]ORX05532.1 glycosyl transferase [Mycolicibacillus trivialis]